MPSKPYAFLKQDSAVLDLADLRSEINLMEDKRQAAFDDGRKLQAAIIGAKFGLERGTDDNANELESLLIQTVGANATRTPREGSLGYRVEDFVRHKAFLKFLESGALLSPSSAPYATDEEYLAGACMGLAQDLARYGLGRATDRDVESVKMAKDLVDEILGFLMTFDFRNGPLRRKYDGTKYSLKSLETLLYELAVTGATKMDSTGQGDYVTREKPSKIARPNESHLLAHDELRALRERMEHRDNLRETLIKRCRDGQKAAKQAIYALHRGDPQKAKQLIDQCESCIQNELTSIVQEEPSLRFGSYANLMEEYAEAKLFYNWLFGDTTQASTAKFFTPPAKLLTREEFAPLQLEPSEYLGGLCDLTGEVGRYAVHRATLRDGEGVKLCLQTNKSILTALQMMERFPRDINKKMDQLNRSVEKLERILYEMSLSEATGRNVQTSSMDVEPDSQANSNNMDD